MVSFWEFYTGKEFGYSMVLTLWALIIIKYENAINNTPGLQVYLGVQNIVLFMTLVLFELIIYHICVYIF